MSKQVRMVLKEVLDARKMTRYQLAKEGDINYQTLDRYYKNMVIRYDNDILLRICTTLNCEVGDILKIVQVQE